MQYIGYTTQVIDGKKGLMLPSITDGHTHFALGATSLDQISLNTATSIAEYNRESKIMSNPPI